MALAIGWVWGASGKNVVERARRGLDEQVRYERGRGDILDGRLMLVGGDYEKAGASFARASAEFEGLQRMLREIGEAELGGRIEIVLAHIRRARAAAAAADANAWSAADAALQALKGIALPE